MIKASELRPMAIMMEDLHWADNSSLELLRSLYRLTENQRLLFINVYRSGYPEGEGTRVAAGRHENIELQPLKSRDSEALINNMLEIKGLPMSIKEQILVRAGGNPFFIEEVVRSLIDDGTVIKGAQGFELTQKINRAVIPTTINDVLMARIDRLEEETRNLIKVASVIGRSFFDRILKEVAASIDDIDERLSYLKDAQFIRDRVRMQEIEYLFTQALVQEAVYESTLLEQRKALHLRVAQSIEKIFQERLHEFYGMLAFHYSKAENLEKAEEYMAKAGDEALRSSASSEALHYFQEALKLYLTKHDQDADRGKRINFEKNIGIALYNRAQWEEAVKYFDSVLTQWGAPLPQRGLVGMLRLAWDLLVMIKMIYLKLPDSKKSPEERYEKIVELSHRAATALAFYDRTRQFQVAMAMSRGLRKFDLSKISSVSVRWASIASVFSAGGLSFRLSNRLLEVSRQYGIGGGIEDRMKYTSLATMIYHCQGAWEKIEELDEDQLNSLLKIGDLPLSTLYLWFYGLVKAEQGEFAGLSKVIEIAQEIGLAFDYPMAIINSLGLKTVYFNTAQRAHEAISVAEKGIAYCQKEGPELQEMMFIGLRSGNQQLAGDQEGSRDSIFMATQIIESQSSKVMPLVMAPYLAACFFIDVDQLGRAIRSENSSDIANFRKCAYESGKAAALNSRKYAPYRTRIFRLMGLYYWLIGQHGKALKWWDKTIQEGESLGARPDLSRTYFELGKRLLEPESKYKELNGIDAKGYLEKAGTLFREMGFDRDLVDLDRLKSAEGLQ
jgi:tetratricopeptide (TPR) repeat protein